MSTQSDAATAAAAGPEGMPVEAAAMDVDKVPATTASSSSTIFTNPGSQLGPMIMNPGSEESDSTNFSTDSETPGPISRQRLAKRAPRRQYLVNGCPSGRPSGRPGASSSLSVASTTIFTEDLEVLTYVQANFHNLLVRYSEVEGVPDWQVAEELVEDIRLHHTEGRLTKKSTIDTFMERLEGSIGEPR